MLETDRLRLLGLDNDIITVDLTTVSFYDLQCLVETHAISLVERYRGVGKIHILNLAQVRHPEFGNVAVSEHCAENTSCRSRITVGILSAAG